MARSRPAVVGLGWASLGWVGYGLAWPGLPGSGKVWLGMAKCKSCDQPVFWVMTESRKMMLVNKEPVPDGNLRLEWRGVEDRHGNPVPTVIYDTSERNLFNEEEERYVSHFATCPARKLYRKDARGD